MVISMVKVVPVMLVLLRWSLMSVELMVLVMSRVMETRDRQRKHRELLLLCAEIAILSAC